MSPINSLAFLEKSPRSNKPLLPVCKEGNSNFLIELNIFKNASPVAALILPSAEFLSETVPRESNNGPNASATAPLN